MLAFKTDRTRGPNGATVIIDRDTRTERGYIERKAGAFILTLGMQRTTHPTLATAKREAAQ